MVIEIMSRQEAIDFSNSLDFWPTAIISITDVDKPRVAFGNTANIYDVLRLSFDDVQKDEPNAMTIDDAKSILKFFKDKCSDFKFIARLIVHCEGGVSRSAAVAAALKTIIGVSDMDIFENPKYAPNKHCYYTLLNTHFGNFPEQEYKFVENIKAYRKAEGLDEEEPEDPYYFSDGLHW